MSDAPDLLPSIVPAAAFGPPAYRVLARKYRPQTFAEMIGQDALVRTLTNAIAMGRIAHAFILTGVRGVGKTTTARIIARALNCIGPDGQGSPTATPCGVCEPCRSIAADRAVDVLEMDAASRTGVDDIREILDGVRYAPVSCRTKIYIIDEVHMLSKSAFNALLKTLEEPPPHVKFVFATTEIRKVPVTVLSRCQRFDLRRIDAALLERHFAGILEKEGAAAEPEALAMIARAADGSARDGLSLLDQAIAQAPAAEGRPHIGAAQLREMLGLADRGQVLSIFEAAAAGDGRRALDLLEEARRAGAEPLATLNDLLDFVHLLTRAKLVPAVLDDPALPEAERVRGGALAAKLSLPALSRAWQMLLKGVGEVQAAPHPAAALEMVVIRLLYTADLPTPAEVIRRLEEGGPRGDGAQPSPTPHPGGGGPRLAAAVGMGRAIAPEPRPEPEEIGPARAEWVEPARSAAPDPARPLVAPKPQSFAELLALAETRDVVLHAQLVAGVHLVHYEPGRLEFRPAEGAPSDLANRLDRALRDWTGERWMVAVSGAPGEPTLAEQARSDRLEALAAAAKHPLVRAVIDAFPGAVIRDVRNPLELSRVSLAEAPPPTDEEERP